MNSGGIDLFVGIEASRHKRVCPDVKSSIVSVGFTAGEEVQVWTGSAFKMGTL